ncbi:ornithine cyclodeaminase family protein [Actinosynnema sp. NPDC023794]
MLVLDSAAVREAYPMDLAIPLMAEVMRRYSGGAVTQPLRTVVVPPPGGEVFASMPCHVAGDTDAGFGLKAVALKPGNPAKGLPSVVGVVVVFDPDTGYPAALLDGAAVTAIRTAAVSAVATGALAAPDAGDLAILGSGVQARSHLEAMALVRDLRRVRVWSRTARHAEEFRELAASTVDVPVEVATTVADALTGADLVCTTLPCREPVVRAADLAPGAHVNAIGASVRGHRELESDAVARCSVFVDSRQSAAVEADDLLIPSTEGLIGADHVLAELGEVLLGRHPGRRDPAEITLYKSLGLAAQDIASGFHVAAAATARGLGTRVAFGPRTGE